MHSVETSGLQPVLNEIIEDKIYVGISAGSMIAAENQAFKECGQMYSEPVGHIESDKGMGWVPFHIRPHLNSPDFLNVTIPKIEEQAGKLNTQIYAIDDQSALVVTGSHENLKTEVVSEGEWKVFNPTR